MNILVIEPDLLAAKLYSGALTAKGHNVTTASTAQYALDVLDKYIPACIILELDMQMHNGFEFLYEFCSQDDWKEVPIILHTNIAPERISGMSVSLEELNVKEYLYKPTTTLKDLQNSVATLLTFNASNQ